MLQRNIYAHPNTSRYKYNMLSTLPVSGSLSNLVREYLTWSHNDSRRDNNVCVLDDGLGHSTPWKGHNSVLQIHVYMHNSFHVRYLFKLYIFWYRLYTLNVEDMQNVQISCKITYIGRVEFQVWHKWFGEEEGSQTEWTTPWNHNLKHNAVRSVDQSCFQFSLY